jgi:hypothetical protein
MTIRTVRCCGMHFLACCALAVSATQGGAQGIPLVVPNLGPQMTPQQAQNLMMMRMMQSRGRHSVRTGVPQDIQMAPGVGGPTPPAATDIKSKSHKSSAEKRAEARKANEEKKRAAKEDAKAKKAKLAKHVKAADNPADGK